MGEVISLDDLGYHVLLPNGKVKYVSWDRGDKDVETSIEKTLEGRDRTHGDFKTQARFAEKLRGECEETGEFYKIPADMRYAISMILMKISRIVHGKPFVKDHWHDIAGYATLVERELSDDGTYKERDKNGTD